MNKSVLFIMCCVVILTMTQPIYALGEVNAVDQQTNDEYNSPDYQFKIQEYEKISKEQFTEQDHFKDHTISS